MRVTKNIMVPLALSFTCFICGYLGVAVPDRSGKNPSFVVSQVIPITGTYKWRDKPWEQVNYSTKILTKKQPITDDYDETDREIILFGFLVFPIWQSYPEVIIKKTDTNAEIVVIDDDLSWSKETLKFYEEDLLSFYLTQEGSPADD